MPVTATPLSLPLQSSAGRQRVYIKSLWSDPWAHVPGLWASNLTWGSLPRIGTATLIWHSFVGWLPHETLWIDQYHGLQTLDLKFVKVECVYPEDGATEPSIRRWFGYIDSDKQRLDDFVRVGGIKKTTGMQVFSAVEVSQVLDDTILLDGWYKDTDTIGGVTRTFANRIRVAPAFNAGGKPNRSDVKVNGCYLFSKYSHGASFWSTKDIVEYLLAQHYPRAGTGAALCRFLNMREGILFDWDRPEVNAHGRSTYSILCELLHIRRGLGAYIEAADDPNEPWTLNPFSHAINDIVLSSENVNQKLLANARQFNLIVDRGNGATRSGRPDIFAVISRDMATQYNRVIAQGRPMRSCFSVNKSADGTLDGDWLDAEKTSYNAGASLDADYSGLPTPAAKWERNNRARNSHELQHVFSRFKLADAFDGKAKGGNGGTPAPILDTPPPEKMSNWPLGWAFHRTLPLYEGQDYTTSQPPKWPYGTADKDEPTPLQTMVFMPLGGGKYTLGRTHGMSQDDSKKRWSIHTIPHRFPPRLIMETHGAQQHAIAKDQFVALSSAMESDAEAQYDWREFIVTLCVEATQLAEAVYPPELPAGGTEIPVLRVKVIDCGTEYGVDYLAGGTVVDLDKETSELKRANPYGGYVRDDRQKLEQIARAAWEFYRRPRVSARFQKPGLTGSLWLGMLLQQIGAANDPPEATTVLNTCVTEVNVTFQEKESDGTAPPPPLQEWVTSHGELDRLFIIPG